LHNLEYSNKAKKFLKSLDKHIIERILNSLERLKNNPILSDSKFIGRDENGEKVFRCRMGDYRALYKLKESEKIILITKIDKKPRVYDK